MKPKKPNNLRFYRQQKEGLTQARLASMAGISERYYQSLENEESEPKIALAQRLATALGVNVTDLFPLPEEETVSN